MQPREVPIPQELVFLLEGSEISTVTVDQSDHGPCVIQGTQICATWLTMQEQLIQYFNHTTQSSWSSAFKTTACCGEIELLYLGKREVAGITLPQGFLR